MQIENWHRCFCAFYFYFEKKKNFSEGKCQKSKLENKEQVSFFPFCSTLSKENTYTNILNKLILNELTKANRLSEENTAKHTHKANVIIKLRKKMHKCCLKRISWITAGPKWNPEFLIWMYPMNMYAKRQSSETFRVPFELSAKIK